MEKMPTKGHLLACPIRLLPDTEIKSQLSEIVRKRSLNAAFILTCCGSVKKATLRFATPVEQDSTKGAERVETFDEMFEICSLVGTVSQDGAHLHTVLGRLDGSTVAGHVVGDLVVQTTAEIILGEVEGLCFKREMDDDTGYPELVINETK